MLNDIFQHLPALPLRSPGLLWCLYWAPCDRNIHLIIFVSVSHHHHLWALIFLSSSKVTATVIMFDSAFPTSKEWKMVTSKQTQTLSSIIKNTRFLHRPDQPNKNYIHTDESRYGAFTKRLQCTSPENHRLADGRKRGGFFCFFFYDLIWSLMVQSVSTSTNIPASTPLCFSFLIVCVRFTCICV